MLHRARGLGRGESGEAFAFDGGPVALGGFAAVGHHGGALARASPAGSHGEAGGVALIVGCLRLRLVGCFFGLSLFLSLLFDKRLWQFSRTLSGKIVFYSLH